MGPMDISDVFKIGREIMGRESTQATMTEDCRFQELFGCGPGVALKVWNLIFEVFPDESIIHMMWALMFLKMYGKESAMSSMAGVDEKTYRKWVWIFVFKIADLEALVVS